MRHGVKTRFIRIPPNNGPYGSARLDSWKQIAVYLNRSVRCVQRWEREEALPVLRLAHKSHASVYADSQELDAWIERRSRKMTTPKSDGSEAGSSSLSLKMELLCGKNRGAQVGRGEGQGYFASGAGGCGFESHLAHNGGPVAQWIERLMFPGRWFRSSSLATRGFDPHKQARKWTRKTWHDSCP